MHFPLDGGINGLAASSGEADLDQRLRDRSAHPPRRRRRWRSPGGWACAAWRPPRCARPAARSSGRSRSRRRCRARSRPRSSTSSRASPTRRRSRSRTRRCSTRLTESEERYRYLVENAPDMVWSIDAEARLTFVSDAVRTADRLAGRRSCSAGISVPSFTSRRARSPRSTGRSGCAPGPQELRGRVNLLARDGPPIPAEFIAIARLDEAGRFVGANGSVRDMRDRDRLERELQESEARFRQLVQTSPDIIYRCDADGRFLFVAEGSERLFGLTPAEMVGMTFADLTGEESLAEALANFEAQRLEHDVVRRFRIPREIPRRDDVPGRDHVRVGLGGRPVRGGPGHGPRRDRSRSASNASCASRRIATGSSSRTRRTSCSRPTPTGASRSCPSRSSG